MFQLTPVVFALVALLVPLGASANDVWLMPRTFEVADDDSFSVFQLSGQPFGRERVIPLRKSLITRFDWVAADTTVPLLTDLLDGRTPVLESERLPKGTALLVMNYAPKTATLRGDVFGRFINTEELHEIQKARLSFLPKHVERERYARFMKSLVQLGPDSNTTAAVQVVGQRLEIVPTSDPRRATLGDTIHVRVLFQGQPLVGALVWGYGGAGRNNKALIKGRTDEHGVAALQVRRKGRWVLRVIHMEACRNCPNADWQSYWATYSMYME